MHTHKQRTTEIAKENSKVIRINRCPRTMQTTELENISIDASYSTWTSFSWVNVHVNWKLEQNIVKSTPTTDTRGFLSIQ